MCKAVAPGAASESSSRALQKVSSEPTLGKQSLRLTSPALLRGVPLKYVVRVGVDWHNTVEIGGHVPGANLTALQRLVDANVGVNLLSYIGRGSKARRDQYYEAAHQLPMANRFERIADCAAKTGPYGKVSLYRGWAVQVAFDDNKEVCQEAFGSKMMVWPINARFEKHEWFAQEGFRPCGTFAIAVHQFLEDHIR